MIKDIDILKHIEDLCYKKGWTIFKLEQKSNMQRGQIRNMIKQKHTPTFYSLQRICDAFDITVGDFFGQVEQKERVIKLPTKDHTQLLYLYDELTTQQQYNVLVYICGMLGLPAPDRQE